MDDEKTLQESLEEEPQLTELEELDAKCAELEDRCAMLNAQLSNYKREYNRVISSGSVKAIFALKKLVGKPYRPKYLYTADNRRSRVVASAAKEVFTEDLPTVTVVIPTYKPCDTLATAVESVLRQDYDADKIEVLLAVNAGDAAYAESLRKTYENEPSVRVIFTEKKGLSVARNFSKPYLRTETVTYLDDDDYFTPGYLRALGCRFAEGVSVVCGCLSDLGEDGIVNHDTYVNRALDAVGTGVHLDYFQMGSLFSSFCGKLYATDLIVNEFGDFDETLRHTEDVVFWVENIHKLRRHKLYACVGDGEQAYIRRLTADSMSRPENREKRYRFYVTERIALIERYTEEIYRDRDLMTKRFVMTKIDASLQMMAQYYASISEVDQEKMRQEAFASDCPFVNKALFARKQGIAFCHNFPPFADASSYVASKRLAQVAEHVGQPVGWTVISADMARSRTADQNWETFYTKYQYKEKKVLDGATYFNEAAQQAWGERAAAEAEGLPAEYIYSRSMWAGSHVAAAIYKKKHPEVIWYAEFSDPVYMDTTDNPRPVSKVYKRKQKALNTFWRDLEQSVFNGADHVIFTNPSQKRYMLEKNPPADPAAVEGKALVWYHPQVARIYADMLRGNLRMDESKINIGYFGTFYANRGIGPMLALLRRPEIELHVFTTITEEHEALAEKYENLHFHDMVSHLEFLNLASRMDYCFLNDIKFDGPINPYIPSKLADYLAAGSRVIAVTREGTELDRYEDPRLVKVPEITAAFTATLTKKEG